MDEMSKHGGIGMAAMRAGMDRKTARKYLAGGKMPSEMVTARDWRTRQDPFADHWPELEAMLRETPELEAKSLFELLLDKYPGRYDEGQLRTLQRRIRQWRAASGPDREVVFAQQHRPAEAAQTDFTSTGELRVTVAGSLFVHMLCVFVLPFSNWQWVTVCLSESMAALRRGVQRALFQLGRVPLYHQTDNSTAATHRIPDGKSERFEGGKRPFNEEYLALMRHFGMTPRTTQVGAKEQNGDVEASNGALKRRLEQALLLRGSRDFDSVHVWQEFVDQVVRKANGGRAARTALELAAMRELSAGKLPEYTKESVTVCERSTIRVQRCAYSVPSRLINEEVQVRLFEERIEVYYRDALQLSCERLRGRNSHRIDYRHVIWSLVRKPGAFARYLYREEMFPSPVFRRAYDAAQASHQGVKGDLEYLRILHLAASTLETDVEAALTLLFAEAKPITADAVKALVNSGASVEVPSLSPPVVDLCAYDSLLSEVGT